jgi:hypothetical protein
MHIAKVEILDVAEKQECLFVCMFRLSNLRRKNPRFHSTVLSYNPEGREEEVRSMLNRVYGWGHNYRSEGVARKIFGLFVDSQVKFEIHE